MAFREGFRFVAEETLLSLDTVYNVVNQVQEPRGRTVRDLNAALEEWERRDSETERTPGDAGKNRAE